MIEPLYIACAADKERHKFIALCFAPTEVEARSQAAQEWDGSYFLFNVAQDTDLSRTQMAEWIMGETGLNAVEANRAVGEFAEGMIMVLRELKSEEAKWRS